jgi:hypothetical protein
MRYEVLLPEIVKMAEAGSGIGLIARAKDSPVNGTSSTVFRPMSDSCASGGAARVSGAGFS